MKGKSSQMDSRLAYKY